MKWQILRALWGLLLVLAGVLFLLNSIGTITIGDYQWAIILGIAGLAFLSVFLANREHWWALFPSLGLKAQSKICKCSWFSFLAPSMVSFLSM